MSEQKYPDHLDILANTLPDIAYVPSPLRVASEKKRGALSSHQRDVGPVLRRCWRTFPRQLVKRPGRLFIAMGVRLAITCLSRKWTDRAVSILQGLVLVAPRVVLTRIWLARAALANFDEITAEEAIRNTAVDGLPNVEFHYCRLAELHLVLENFDEAARYLLLAECARPNSPVVCKLRGRLYDQQGAVDSAVACYQRQFDLEHLVRLKVRALLSIAEILADAGREEAASFYRKVLEFSPNESFAYFGLVMCQKVVQEPGPLLEAIRRLLTLPPFDDFKKSHLHFALGIIHDKENEVGMAFSHFMLGNQIITRSRGSTDLNKIESDVEARRVVFSADAIATLSQHGCQEEFLVCIVGMPRSGTSLAEQILAGHTDVRGLGERTDICYLVQRLRRELKSRREYPHCLKNITSLDIQRFAHKIHDRLQRLAKPCLRIVTKRPNDFWELGLLKILFPKVHLIHMERDAIDTCWSCYSQNFWDVHFSTDLESLAGVYRCYRQMMEHWHEVLPAGSILNVRYETLVADPESTIKMMCSFSGIPFQQSCMEFYRHGRPVKTMSRQQVRQPIYSSSVRRSARYREFLGPLLALDQRPLIDS